MSSLLVHRSNADRAFERLYQRYALDIYRYAYAVLHNQADAEDVTQTTFLNAYRALERGEDPQNPHNWLIAITHNVCRQRFRQQARRVPEVGLEVDVADALVGDEDDDAPSPADITRALGHLAFNQRAALVMRELEGRSYAEIAAALSLSIGAVETLIFRARRALREQLEGSLTCGQAEHFLSRKLDGELARGERSQLRAHLRECASCRRLARSQRAHRTALKALGPATLPASLASLFGGGGAAAVVTKVAAVVVASSVAAGSVGYGAHELLQSPPAAPRPARTTPTRPLPATPIAGIALATRDGRKAVHATTPAAPPQRTVVHTVGRPVHEPATTSNAPATEPQRPEQGERPQPAPHDPGLPAQAPVAASSSPGRAPGGADPQQPAPAVAVPELPVPPPPVPAPAGLPVTVPAPPVETPQLPGLGH